eukprot:TRINITY_DN20_c0_g1_i5.p1 TRINITY_DN20_c0_g1~~TRINITY_DN20_c0_g1_i5.p1  ORF type:complete len:239 (-),score=43.84 TRINITY_DN20_c0_g1_i5:470-1186(-)
MAQALAHVQVVAGAILRSPFSGAARAVSTVSNGSKVSMRAPYTWLPGQPRPSYLDGSAPADYGFDPLSLGVVPSNYARYQISELIHSRWAMLAVPGVLIPEALGLGNWVDAQQWAASGGSATYLGQELPWGNLPVIIAIESLAIAFVEAKRVDEPDYEKKKYPGGAFDPLGFAKDESKLDELKTKELNNGRLAMLAFLGFSVQSAVYPGTGPLDNLLAHLADPLHANIADILIPRNVL